VLDIDKITPTRKKNKIYNINYTFGHLKRRLGRIKKQKYNNKYCL